MPLVGTGEVLSFGNAMNLISTQVCFTQKQSESVKTGVQASVQRHSDIKYHQFQQARLFRHNASMLDRMPLTMDSCMNSARLVVG